MLRFPVLFALLLPLSTQATIFTVGSNASCSHTTIQGAIDAAAASPGADQILITRSQTYGDQQLLISSQTLTIAAGGATCIHAPDGSTITISGADGAALPVMRINTSGEDVVTLQRLQITGGDVGGDNLGGGILYNGSNDSRLVIEHSTISGNSAAYGGGIYANGNGSRAHLIIGAHTLIASNEARISGGGIYLSNADLIMDAPESAIANNLAGDFGGGLRALGPSDILITSGGIGTLGTIFGNEARIGGGIALQGSPSTRGSADLRLNTVDPQKPVRIRGNVARELGGALYARPDLTTETSRADAVLLGVSIEENFAQTGAAVYLDYDDSFVFTLGAEFFMYPGVGCGANDQCNRVIGNKAETIGGVATNGGILLGGDRTRIWLTGTQVFGNNGGPTVYVDDAEASDGVPIRLDQVAIANNVVRGNAIVRLVRGIRSQITNSTIANNSLSGSNIVEAAGQTTLDGSILWQHGKTTLVSGTRNVGRVLASETASLGAALLAINGEPRFIDPANNNFRLRAGSRAIDVAPAVVGDDRDADGLPRDQDLDLVANLEGVRDLGAFERQTLLPLVQNGDFVSDARLWPEVVNNVSIFQSENSSSTPDSGSLRVTENGGSIATLQARRQCVSLPGPSDYQLNGFARSYSTGLFRDTPSLQWRLRSDSSDCTGSVIAEGVHVLPNSTTWAAATQPATISISSAQWTFNSTLEIVLVATDDRPLPPNNIELAFDRITLVPGTVAMSLFADGFE